MENHSYVTLCHTCTLQHRHCLSDRLSISFYFTTAIFPVTTAQKGSKMKKKTHDECRALVCLICYCKVNKNGKNIRGKIEELVKKKVTGYSDYSESNSIYPNKICANCSWKLSKADIDITPHNPI